MKVRTTRSRRFRISDDTLRCGLLALVCIGFSALGWYIGYAAGIASMLAR